MKFITVLFYIGIIAAIIYVSLAFYRVRKNQRIYFIGDSHMFENDFPNTIAAGLGTSFTFNDSHNGAKTIDFINNTHIKDFNPDMVVIRLGANDIYAYSGKYDFDNYVKLLRYVRTQTTAPIYLISNTKTKDFVNETIAYNKEISKLSTLGVHFINIYGGTDYTKQVSDGIHFTSAGYKQQGNLVVQEMKKVI